MQFVLNLLHLTIGATESGVASPFKLLGIVVPKLASAFPHWVYCVFSASICVRGCIVVCCACRHACVRNCVHVCLRACMHACVCACVRVHVHACTAMYVQLPHGQKFWQEEYLADCSNNGIWQLNKLYHNYIHSKMVANVTDQNS